MLVNSQSPKTCFWKPRLVLERGQGEHEAAGEDVRLVDRGPRAVEAGLRAVGVGVGLRETGVGVGQAGVRQRLGPRVGDGRERVASEPAHQGGLQAVIDRAAVVGPERHVAVADARDAVRAGRSDASPVRAYATRFCGADFVDVGHARAGPCPCCRRTPPRGRCCAAARAGRRRSTASCGGWRSTARARSPGRRRTGRSGRRPPGSSRGCGRRWRCRRRAGWFPGPGPC